MKFVLKNLGNFNSATIIPISDIHIGDKNSTEKPIKKIISDLLKYQNVYGVLVGDLINNALKNSKSDSYEATMTPQSQRDRIIKLLMPVRHKLLGCTSGNHEDRTTRDTSIDISRDIANALLVPYDEYGLYYHLKIGEKGKQMNYTMYTTHGFGGAGTKGAKANKLHSLKDICLADIYVMGHVHDLINFPDSYFVPDTRHNKVIKIDRHFCTSGSSLNYGGYAERMMLKPSKIGFPIITLNGTVKDVKITI